MTLHPQIAALAAQLEELSALLRGHGDRWWSAKIDLCRGLITDSNFTGVEKFLALLNGAGGFADFKLRDGEGALLPDHLRLVELRQAARTLAERLAREERSTPDRMSD
ncbi:hypothetical protein FHS51_000601 [Sphingobium wenxiniae]|uniref:Uncharacterized protein n=2 Tax=Sphingobium TaxID=165695 RepID=T0HG49_9SPHN|nr:MULTISPECIES: hypothetical protein [Sphingobium]EQA96523.1 hypothetical protein L485_24370 [Sphingobium baderi LL03]KMS64480.1 hypothetical protein V475_00295 [Sphingobium baderi LL03]MBB6190388.1 hypothetical protein [Sphingobium wenxiniae]TWH95106.1 hypothetical protein IQ35_01358 [Sphingobium wenxiniae]WRD74971.1 hypothetical protein QQ987_09100 [Sphingobium baderi]